MAAVLAGSRTPADWITISSPCTATFGEDTPSLASRLVMICCAKCIPAGVTRWPFAGTARKVSPVPEQRWEPPHPAARIERSASTPNTMTLFMVERLAVRQPGARGHGDRDLDRAGHGENRDRVSLHRPLLGGEAERK